MIQTWVKQTSMQDFVKTVAQKYSPRMLASFLFTNEKIKWSHWKTRSSVNDGYSIGYLRQGGYVFVVVCLSVCLSVCLFASNFAQNNSERICMKYSLKVGNGPMKK